MPKTQIISACNSKWSAPIPFVKMKSGMVRVCCEYDLNKVTENFYWPLPNIDDAFSFLGNSKFLTTLDFVKGYHRIAVDADSKLKMAKVCFNLMSYLLVSPVYSVFFKKICLTC